ncbi:DUF3833 family protein [Aestuariivirga sp.]|jgi:hypothetical protein|uniref:DUF3833 family protein n=1 Tax=Aestuariivirga sp. TaxID=2650926 RepID=UPI0037839775
MLKKNDSARFDLLAYFEGHTLAHGVFEDRGGRIKRRFAVEMTGRWEAGAMVVDEDFLFDDGERQQRCWTLVPKTSLTFTGTCADAVGEAHGHISDGCAYLRSTLRIKVGSRLISMDFDDAFYDGGGGLVLNRSTVRKLGIRVGQVLIAFRKA